MGVDDGDEDRECGRCHETMHIPPGAEPSEFCHDCAHSLVDELRARVAELEAALSDVTADDFMARYNALRADAERYRFLRDRAGNAIMQQLMADCVPSGWNTKVDAARAAEVKK